MAKQLDKSCCENSETSRAALHIARGGGGGEVGRVIDNLKVDEKSAAVSLDCFDYPLGLYT